MNDLVGPGDGVPQDDARPVQARRLVVPDQLLGEESFAHQVRDRLDRDAARNLTRVVAAHAVRQHVEADVRVERDRVLVVLAHLAGVGQTDGLDAIPE